MRWEDTPRPALLRRLPWWLLAVVVAAWVIVSHGCHGGDHDDELCLPAEVKPCKR